MHNKQRVMRVLRMFINGHSNQCLSNHGRGIKSPPNGAPALSLALKQALTILVKLQLGDGNI